jgi:ADP-heptose:LPS heptosyltransferase
MGLVRDLSPQIKNFADTAALIQQLDEVVTVDTAAAHLVGALGKPGHVLLAHGAIDWRWMVKTDKTPWYPTLKLHRQKPGQSWRDLLTEVRL